MNHFLAYLFCVSIFATLAGGFGGSFQPARILLVGMAIMALSIASNPRENSRLLDQILGLVLAIILSGMLSLSWTKDLIGGVGMLLAVSTGGCALFAIRRMHLNVNSLKLVMFSWVGVVAISVVVAFYEIMTGNHFQFAMEARVIGGNFGDFPFAAIMFGNYNDYSAWLCLAFPITMAAFLEVRKTWSRSFVILINLAVVAIIFVNTSRTALVYVALVVLFYIVKFQTFRLDGVISSILTVPLVLARYGSDILKLYELAVYRFTVSADIDESYTQRSGLISAGITAVRESWGFGIGIGGFEEYINDNYPYFIPNPHNILLEISINFGIFGLIMFICIVIFLFFAGWRRTDLPLGFRLSLMFGTCSVPIVGAVQSQAIGYVFWWVWLATLAAMAAIPRDSSISMAAIRR